MTAAIQPAAVPSGAVEPGAVEPVPFSRCGQPGVRPPAAARRRGNAALLWHQVRYEQLSFWRNPQSAFFTFLFPVVIIAIFGALFGGSRSSFFYGLTPLQYYVPTIAAVSVLGACYSQLAIVLSIRRQNGILKRVRATPLPAWTYFLGLLAHCIVVSAVDVALIAGVGRPVRRAAAHATGSPSR